MAGTKKTRPKQPAEADNLLERVRQTARKAADLLDKCVTRVEEKLNKPDYDTGAASHLAYLTKHLVQYLDALRKLEAHDQAAPKKMSPEERDELVMSYLAELPRDRRAQVRAYLDGLDQAGGVL